MDNISQRNISETRENLVGGKPLSYNNIMALYEAYTYGTATPMIALIKTLKIMYSKVKEENQIYYMDKNGYEKTINVNNFEEFVLSYFDAYVLKEIYDDKNEIYN